MKLQGVPPTVDGVDDDEKGVGVLACEPGVFAFLLLPATRAEARTVPRSHQMPDRHQPAAVVRR